MTSSLKYCRSTIYSSSTNGCVHLLFPHDVIPQKLHRSTRINPRTALLLLPRTWTHFTSLDTDPRRFFHRTEFRDKYYPITQSRRIKSTPLHSMRFFLSNINHSAHNFSSLSLSREPLNPRLSCLHKVPSLSSHMTHKSFSH